MTGPLLTARQVAELVDVSAETVLRWTRRGELPAIKLPGGAIRYRPEALEDWFEAHATPGGTGVAETPEPENRRRQATLQPSTTTSRAILRGAETPAQPRERD